MSLSKNQLLGCLAFKIADVRFSRSLSELEARDLEAVMAHRRGTRSWSSWQTSGEAGHRDSG